MPKGKAKGSDKTGGRKKGTPNKATQAVKDAILEAFNGLGGVKYLEKIGKEDPKTFLTLLGKVVPAEVKADISGKMDIIVEVVKYTE